ncbi:MAG: histidine phosphatase family protein [bacterium]|nr:histidine phosphatase family protein [bacterium]
MIIFARHAQTKAGEEERFEGLADSSLTDLGERQAKALGIFLRDKKIHEVVVSPRKRAFITAKLALQGMQKEILVNTNLAEVCYGAWEHKKKDTIKKTKLWEVRQNDPFHFVHPGMYLSQPGESYSMLYERSKNTLLSLKATQKNVLVVSHLGILRCVYMFFSGIDEREFVSSQFANTVLCVVSHKNTIRFFDYFNQKEVLV